MAKEISFETIMKLLGQNKLVISVASGFVFLILVLTSSDNNPLNFVIIFVDDMGYGDIGNTGHPTILTPNLERMADEGVTMTQFYAGASVCSPSRAALLTGRYPIRNGVVSVFFQQDTIGLPKSEITLADLLNEYGYATAAIGKWHLGNTPDYFPTRRGFDYFYGLMYSNDMAPLQLYRNEEVIENPVNQNTLTKRYTEESIKFIEDSRNRPFFLYLPHSMPHTPLAASEQFQGHSKRGLYGDAVEELDWSVGQIIDALKKNGLDDNTLVIFTSDNGPMETSLVKKVWGKPLSYDGQIDPNRPWNVAPTHGGSAGLFRGGKATTFEGGLRVPFIARLPGKLKKGLVITEVGTVMDLFTTCLTLAGIQLPDDRPIDGQNLMPVLQGESPSYYNALYYYWNDEMTAIRSGSYKLHFKICTPEWEWLTLSQPELYDVEIDPSEKYNIADDNPEIVEQLKKQAEIFKEEIKNHGENKELIYNMMHRGKKM